MVDVVRADVVELLMQLSYVELGDVRGWCLDRMQQLRKKLKADDLFKRASTLNTPTTQYKESSE